MNIFDSVELLFPVIDIMFPLQKLTRFLNYSHKSPIGLDISLEFGLWFATRAVGLVNEKLDKNEYLKFTSPYINCEKNFV